MTEYHSSKRINLNVPYREKDLAKGLGAKFDWATKQWFIPPGVNPSRFDRWIDEKDKQQTNETEQQVSKESQHIGLTEALIQMNAVITSRFNQPIWVKADIVKIKRTGAHVYLSLEERDDNGKEMASVGAMIWGRDANRLIKKFKEGTGQDLGSNMAVLIAITPQLHSIFGFKLIVTDIDPQFTLGQLEAKKKRIRQTLISKGYYNLNQSLLSPIDFTRIAVISPKDSASLADFTREALILQKHGLCQFDFHHGTFEGPNAIKSLLGALQTTLSGLTSKHYDAIVLIRGGGSKVSLSWLDDYDLAQALCTAPIPVLTGIGHKSDRGILDEIANQSFDTPSKVIGHIQNTIIKNGMACIQDINTIKMQTKQVLENAHSNIRLFSEKSRSIPQIILYKVSGHLNATQSQVLLMAKAKHSTARLRIETLKIGNEQIRLFNQGMSQRLKSRISEILSHWKQLSLASRIHCLGYLNDSLYISRLMVGRTASLLAQLNDTNLNAINHICKGQSLENQRVFGSIQTHLKSISKRYTNDIRVYHQHTQDGAKRIHQNMLVDIQYRFKIILGRGPSAVLKQGYTIARTMNGHPISKAKDALKSTQFQLEFNDGLITVRPISNLEVPDDEKN